MAYFETAAGLIILILGGDFLVRGAVTLAQRFNISKLVIGLTIVAFGTSAPELMVGVEAVLKGAPTLALGNVVGSNIANILLVVGLPALVAPMACTAPRLTRHMVMMVGSILLLIAFSFAGPITFWHGGILFALLVGFLIYSGFRSRQHDADLPDPLTDFDAVDAKPGTPLMSSLLIVGGLIGLVLGANLLVDGSVTIARSMGISEAVIGLTLVAIGTSLPELATSLAAALRRHCDVAVGNVIGSNIFNTLGIVGVSSFFGDIPVPEEFLQFDLWVMLVASLSIIPFALFRTRIGRASGVIFIGAYLVYLALLAHGASAMSH